MKNTNKGFHKDYACETSFHQLDKVIKFQFQNFMKSDKAIVRSGQQYAIWWVIGLYLTIIGIPRFCCAHEC